MSVAVSIVSSEQRGCESCRLQPVLISLHGFDLPLIYRDWERTMVGSALLAGVGLMESEQGFASTVQVLRCCSTSLHSCCSSGQSSLEACVE